MKKTITIVASYLITFAPAIALAAPQNLSELIDLLIKILYSALPLIFGIAFLVFVWGIVKYIQGGDDPEKRKEGSQFMFYGIIAFFIMVSFWAFVNVVSRTFFDQTGSIPVPGQLISY